MEKAYGASVRGQYHVENGLSNQDAFLVDNQKFYTLAIVCDGLGSKKHSRTASRRLCRIIRKEVKIRFKQKALNPTDFIKTVQKKFCKKIWPFKLKDCDTTCLISLISSKNVILFQVGDGLNAVKFDSNLVKCHTDEKDFTNETKSFGKSRMMDWHFKSLIKEEGKKYEILMCTDGISEDIIEDTLPDFIYEVCKNAVGKAKNNPLLKKILKEWPNKYSKDDKTIVVVK